MSRRVAKDPVPLAPSTLDHPTQGALGDPASGVQLKVNDTIDAQSSEAGAVIEGTNSAINVTLDEIEAPDINSEAKPRVHADPSVPDQDPEPEAYSVDAHLETAAASYKPSKRKPNEAAKHGLAKTSTEKAYQITAKQIRYTDNRIAREFGTEDSEDW